MNSRTRDWLIFVVGAIACVVCYQPAMNGEWLWDDTLWFFYIANDPNNYQRIWFSFDMFDYWPLTYTLYNIEHELFRMDFWKWHMVSLSLHLITSTLIYIIAKQWKIPGALFAALIFMLHPVSTAAVGWVTQQKTLLMTLFLAWSTIHLNKWLKSESIWHYMTCIFLFALACLSKTQGVCYPFIVLAVMAVYHNRLKLSYLIYTIPFLIISALTGAATVIKQFYSFEGNYAPELSERLASIGWSSYLYLIHTFIPARLAMLYPSWIDHINEIGPIAYIPTLFLATGCALLCYMYYKAPSNTVVKWFFLTAFGFFFIMLPILGFFPMAFMQWSMAGDFYHYTGLPILLFGAIGILFIWLKKYTKFLAIALSLILLPLAYSTYQRAHIYVNELLMWDADLEYYPESTFALTNSAAYMLKLPEYTAKDADADVKREIELECEKRYLKSIELDPEYPNPYLKYGELLIELKEFEKAFDILKKGHDLAIEKKQLQYRTFFLFEIARTQLARGQYKKGLITLNSPVNAPPTCLRSFDMIWRVYHHHKQYEGFVNETNKLLESKKIFEMYPDFRRQVLEKAKEKLKSVDQANLIEGLPKE